MAYEFWPLLFSFALGVGFSGLILFVAHKIRPRVKKPAEEHPDTFECGIPYIGDARSPFNVRFYIIAVLFILFDIEIIFLFPWAATFGVYKEIGRLGFIILEMFLFLGILFLGYFYILKKGALDWEDPT